MPETPLEQSSIPGAAVILIVDDEGGIRESLCKIFAKELMTAVALPSGDEALHWLRGRQADVVLTDLVMPGLSGLDLLRTARSLDPDVEVIMMTAYGTVDSAVEAMRSGAYDFITKPLKRHEVVKAVKRALEHRGLVAENRYLRNQIAASRLAGWWHPARRCAVCFRPSSKPPPPTSPCC